MKYSLALLSAILFFMASCEKVEVPRSKEDVLRESRWQAKEIWKKYRKPNDTLIVTDTIRRGNLAECKGDDYLQFMTNNMGSLKSNEKKCGGEVDEISFRWGITDQDTRMYIYEAGEMFDGNNNVDGKLVMFSDAKLRLEYTKLVNNFYTTDKGTVVPRVDTVWYTTFIEKL